MMRKTSTILISLGLVACGAYTLTGAETLMAEAGARDYAERSNAKFISCSGQDSDRDSYVTCTIQPASGPPEALLCAYKQRGCKAK